MKNLVKLGFCCCAIALVAVAQDSTPPSPPTNAGAPPAAHEGGRGGMRGARVIGEITAVSSDGFTIKEQNGEIKQVKVASNTRLMRNRQPVSLSEFKVGTSVVAAGEPDPNNPSLINARFVIDNTEQMKEFKENLGKTIIAGEVKAIQDTQLTILRPDGQTQVIEADEGTSFEKGRNSITLADIKPGDHVMGHGQIKNGVFVPTNLRVGGMGGGGMFMMGRGGDRPSPPPQAQPGSAGDQPSNEQQPK